MSTGESDDSDVVIDPGMQRKPGSFWPRLLPFWSRNGSMAVEDTQMKFRMIDRIVDWTPRRAIHGVKTVSFEEYQLREPLGYPPHLPESLILESLFQLANWLVILSTDYQQMCIGAQWDEASFFDTLRPGSRMLMEVTVDGWRDDSVIVEGLVSNGLQTVAAVRRCLAALVPLADYYDPDDLRVLYSEIYRPDPTALPGASSCPV